MDLRSCDKTGQSLFFEEIFAPRYVDCNHFSIDKGLMQKDEEERRHSWNERGKLGEHSVKEEIQGT